MNESFDMDGPGTTTGLDNIELELHPIFGHHFTNLFDALSRAR
jgi:hypothetical protein